jgi:hypothetical protein
MNAGEILLAYPRQVFMHQERGFANQNYESKSTVPLIEVVVE